MKISAILKNSESNHKVTLKTNDNTHSIDIKPKLTGFGSSTNGGKLLFLALATCYCNDIYQEALKRDIHVDSVEVEGGFGAEGDPAKNVTYRAKVAAQASETKIRDLMRYTDGVTEIQNTLGAETSVTLAGIEAVTV